MDSVRFFLTFWLKYIKRRKTAFNTTIFFSWLSIINTFGLNFTAIIKTQYQILKILNLCSSKHDHPSIINYHSLVICFILKMFRKMLNQKSENYLSHSIPLLDRNIWHVPGFFKRFCYFTWQENVITGEIFAASNWNRHSRLDFKNLRVESNVSLTTN